MCVMAPLLLSIQHHVGNVDTANMNVYIGNTMMDVALGPATFGHSLNAVSLVAPRVAGQIAFDLCFTPRPRRTPSGREQLLLRRADRTTVTLDGRALAVYRWSSGPGADAETVVLVHGWASAAARMTAWVEPLLSRGFSVLALDLPAHGESEGKRTNGLDMAAAVRAVAAASGRVRGVVAHSAGAYASAMAAAGGHLFGKSAIEVDSLVLIAAVDDPALHLSGFGGALGLSDRVCRLLRDRVVSAFGHDLSEFSLTRIPGTWNQPTILFHDPDDREVPFGGAEAIASTIPHSVLVPVDGAGHHRIARDPAVIERAVAHLQDAL
jgi:pimeloyl-ACP methyl ester carboxylesterase